MRALVLALVLALSACAAPPSCSHDTTGTPQGVYRVRRLEPLSTYTGYALPAGGVLSLFHGARDAELADILTEDGAQRVSVTRRDGDVIVLDRPGGVDLVPGVSGAVVLGVIEGRRER